MPNAWAKASSNEITISPQASSIATTPNSVSVVLPRAPSSCTTFWIAAGAEAGAIPASSSATTGSTPSSVSPSATLSAAPSTSQAEIAKTGLPTSFRVVFDSLPPRRKPTISSAASAISGYH